MGDESEALNDCADEEDENDEEEFVYMIPQGKAKLLTGGDIKILKATKRKDQYGKDGKDNRFQK